MSHPVDTARALGFSTVVTGVRLPFAAMNAAGSAATAAEVRALARSRTGAVVLKTATVHPFVHPGFRSLCPIFQLTRSPFHHCGECALEP